MSSLEFFRERGINVSRETFDRLKLYHDILIRWQRACNLISDSTLPYIWERHFLDSAQLISCISSSTQTIVDLGSGAGFPGIVIALLTDIPSFLVESNHKKSSFLREVKRITGAPIEIISHRIEDLPSLQGDVVMARAVSDLSSLLNYASLHLKKEGSCLFLKGKDVEKEIKEAHAIWRFSEKKYPSITDCTGIILEIKEITRKR